MYVTIVTFLGPFLRKSKIELIIAINTWNTLKATYLLALLHISTENTAYVFEIRKYIKYFEKITKQLQCGNKGGAFD